MIPKKQEHSNGNIVNYNIYINSTIYNGNERKPASQSEVSVPIEITKEAKKDTPLASQILGGVFYRVINVTQLSNLSKASRASNLNYNINFDFNHQLYSQFKIHYIGNLESEKYEDSDAYLFKLGIDLAYPVLKYLNFRGGISYKQSPIVNTVSGEILVESLSHPQLNIQLDFDLLSFWETQLVSSLRYDYFLGTKNDDIELISGANYQFDLGLNRKLFNQNIGISIWYQNSSIVTNNTKQTSAAIGSNIIWQTSF